MDVEVVVVGGGLVGMAVASRLVDAGHEVVVIERHEAGHDKVCGEGLMPHGVAAFEALGWSGVLDAIGAPPLRGIRWRSPGASMAADFPGGRVGRGVDRARLGAELRRTLTPRLTVVQDHIRALDRHDAAVAVRGQAATYRARLVIGADGLHSVVRRAIGVADLVGSPRRIGLRERWGVDHGLDRVEVRSRPGVEVYLTPVGPRRLNVALLVQADDGRRGTGGVEAQMRDGLGGWPDLVDLRARGEILTAAAATGPLRQRTRAVSAERVLLVGDAAGFLDGITGEGMSLGLLGALDAAEVASRALRGGDLAAAGLAEWDRRHRARTQEADRLTELVLWWIRQPRLTDAVVADLGRRPADFAALLGVMIGDRPMGPTVARWLPGLLLRLAVGGWRAR